MKVTIASWQHIGYSKKTFDVGESGVGTGPGRTVDGVQLVTTTPEQLAADLSDALGADSEFPVVIVVGGGARQAKKVAAAVRQLLPD